MINLKFKKANVDGLDCYLVTAYAINFGYVRKGETWGVREMEGDFAYGYPSRFEAAKTLLKVNIVWKVTKSEFDFDSQEVSEEEALQLLSQSGFSNLFTTIQATVHRGRSGNVKIGQSKYLHYSPKEKQCSQN